MLNNSLKFVVVKASFASPTQLRASIGILNENGNDNIFLCKSHYNKLYRDMYPPVRCASCNAYPRKGPFTHHSPNPQLVATFLNDVNILKADDVLCLTCYMVHLSIITSIETRPIAAMPS
jgi:hypothetical protein